MRRLSVLLLSVIFLLPLFSKIAHAQWAATYWGSEIYSIHQTQEDGFITVIGDQSSMRLQKLDPSGVPLWSKYYYYNNGGSSYFSSWSSFTLLRSALQITSDGGYAVTTLIHQQPNGTYGAGYQDIWFLKLDAEGEVQWQRTYGGGNLDSPCDMKQTADGGYILAGRTKSFSPEGVWVFKLDADGNIEWENTYGGTIATSIQQTMDNGYILTGWTASDGAGGTDIWVLKLDADGQIEPGLQKTYGGSNDDIGHIIKQTADGGYILGADTRSFNIQPGTLACMWILKLDPDLNVTWQKTYSGTSLLDGAMIRWFDREIPHDIIQTADGNFVVAGSTNHFGQGAQEAWILKLEAAGQGAILWERTYGGLENSSPPTEYSEAFFSVLESTDGHITAAGSTQMGLGSLGFIITMDGDGQVPGCGLMNNSNAIVTDTAVTGQTTSATAQATFATVLLPPGVANEVHAGLKEFICPDGIDLSITMDDIQDPILPNHYVAYELTAANLGTDQATNVSVSASLPAGLTYFSATATQGTASTSADTVTFDIGLLPSGGSATLSIIARAGLEGAYEVTADITADEIAFDQILENNKAGETTTVSALLSATVDSMDWANIDMAVDSKGYAHIVYTKDNDLRYATNVGGRWLRWTLIDSGAVYNTAIALDRSDRVHIAYAEGPGYDDNALQYIHNLDRTWSNPETVVASAGATGSLDISVGTDDSVHLCYLYGGMAMSSSLTYVTNQGQSSGNWSSQILHSAGYDSAALALDPNNYAHVVFYSFQVISGDYSSGGVGYVTNAPGGIWQPVEEVDPDWVGCQMEGMTLDIAVDADNVPHIVFNGDADGEYEEDTRYAVRTGGVWELDEIEDGGCYGAGKSIALDNDGNTHVSYYRTPNNDLRVADNISGTWQHKTISTDGWFNTIAVDRLGQAHVGYYDSGLLKYAVAHSVPDSDGDGVGDATEASAPNSGDGNNDGTPDSNQSHVVSLETFNGSQMVTLVAPDTTVLTQVKRLDIPDSELMPENTTFPLGFFDFALLGAPIGTTTQVEFLLPDSSANTYFKFGPTPLTPEDHYYLFEYDGETGAIAAGSTITLNLMDGERGDHDLKANGIIRDPGGPAVGPAGMQQIRLSPPILDFEDVVIGETTDLVLSIMNVGSADLSIDGLSSVTAPFSISVDDCSGTILPADGSCNVIVGFTPFSPGDARQVLLVLSDDPSFPSLGVTLLGTGTPASQPEIQASPTQLAFGEVDMGSSAEQNILIINNGMETLHVGTVVAPVAPYSIVEDNVSGAVIHTSDSAVLTIRFAPDASGPVDASLQIPSDDPDNATLIVPLMGIGVGDPAPEIAVSESAVDFGDVTTGTVSDHTVNIQNQGDADLALGTITHSGTPFSLAGDTCSGQSVASGSMCSITVQFGPASTGPYAGSLSVPSNDSDENPLVISLSGNGTDVALPVLSVSPETLDFGEATTQDTFTISNSGAGTLSWSISPALPDWITVTPMSGETISAPTQVTVNIDPTQVVGQGSHNTSILISSNAGSGSVSVYMTKPNMAPVAVAAFEPDMAPAGNPVQLNGSDSYDPDGDPITYQWAWVFDPDTQTFPPAFGAMISDYQAELPIMTAPYAGEYTLALTVSDGELESEAALISITLVDNPVANAPPIADAGQDIDNGITETPIQLDGTGSSDPDGAIIHWRWQWVWDEENGTAPVALGASLSDYNIPNPVFQTPQPGTYTLSLTVTDSRRAVSTDEIVIAVTDVELEHMDSDGIDDIQEHGPNADNPQFDGNSDGLPDGMQHNVASFYAYDLAGYITMASAPGSFLTLVSPQDIAAAPPAPDGIEFPLALFDFTINNLDAGGSTTLTYYLPDGIEVDTYYKYGPTPNNPVDHWYEFMWDGETGAQINGTIITLYFVDGQRGDDDLISDNRIVDLGGPAISSGLTPAGNPSGGDGGSSGCFIGSLFDVLQAGHYKAHASAD